MRHARKVGLKLPLLALLGLPPREVPHYDTHHLQHLHVREVPAGTGAIPRPKRDKMPLHIPEPLLVLAAPLRQPPQRIVRLRVCAEDRFLPVDDPRTNGQDDAGCEVATAHHSAVRDARDTEADGCVDA
ncbi:hypothetical protein V490_09434, partial [Pseudogymnoascus sp. VKM F-3557]